MQQQFILTNHAIERWVERFPNGHLEDSLHRSVLKAIGSRGDETWIDRLLGVRFRVVNDGVVRKVVTVLEVDPRDCKMVKKKRAFRKRRREWGKQP